VGQVAAQNRVAEDVIQRIVRIFNEQHLEWVYPSAAEALGALGAAQALPREVHAAMQALFENSRRPGERENLARAFAQIAAGQTLPAPILDALAATLEVEPNEAHPHPGQHAARSRARVLSTSRRRC
jgi:hypothetical protein